MFAETAISMDAVRLADTPLTTLTVYEAGNAQTLERLDLEVESEKVKPETLFAAGGSGLSTNTKARSSATEARAFFL